tara:strand:- start:1468 stop:1854 length:387 start_codon:yes stop_codon:yes gene_type:complete
MVVTATQVRDLLNRPRGLNEETINEYITIRTAEVDKKARSSILYGVSENGVTENLKESAIKMLVATDCLRVMIDTIPSYVPENQQRQQDIRVRAQLASLDAKATSLLADIAETGGTAFVVKSSTTRQV